MSQSVEDLLTNKENKIRKWWNICTILDLIVTITCMFLVLSGIVDISKSKLIEGYSLEFIYRLMWINLIASILIWYYAYFKQATFFLTWEVYGYRAGFFLTIFDLRIYIALGMIVRRLFSLPVLLVILILMITGIEIGIRVLHYFLCMQMRFINKKIQFQRLASNSYQESIELLKGSKTAYELIANYKSLKQKWPGWRLAFKWQYKLCMQILKGRASL